MEPAETLRVICDPKLNYPWKVQMFVKRRGKDGVWKNLDYRRTEAEANKILARLKADVAGRAEVLQSVTGR